MWLYRNYAVMGFHIKGLLFSELITLILLDKNNVSNLSNFNLHLTGEGGLELCACNPGLIKKLIKKHATDSGRIEGEKI